MSAPGGPEIPPTKAAAAGPKAADISFEKRLRRDLVVTAVLLAAIINPGELYSVDSTRRLQVARWIWAGEPSVVAGDWGLPGADGGQHYIFGLGQSLVMIPFDMVAAAAVAGVAGIVELDHHAQQGMRLVILSFLMQSLIAAAGVLTAFSLLRRLNFTEKESAAGALGLILGTTYLHYIQNCQENNLLLLTTLIGFERSLRWLAEPLPRHAIIAGVAMGFGLLTRLTAAADFLALGLFVVLAIAWRSGVHALARNPDQEAVKKTGDSQSAPPESSCESEARPGGACASPGFFHWMQPLVFRRAWGFFRVFLVPYALFGLADRAYHYYRFGEFWSTYIHIWGRHEQQNGAPAGFPFGYPFSDGFWGALVSPDNSIFLFDPLIVITVAMAIFSWKHLSRQVRGFLLACTFLLFFQICFHATFYTYSGEVSWGDRFVASPVHLLSLAALPLLLREGANISVRGVRGLLWALVPVSVSVQLASATLNMSVERIQIEGGHSRFLLANRIDNLSSVLSGKAAEDKAFAGIPEDWRALNFLPFRLERRYPALARVAFVVWLGLCGVFLAHLLRLVLEIKSLPAAPTRAPELSFP